MCLELNVILVFLPDFFLETELVDSSGLSSKCDKIVFEGDFGAQ
jgi:hypothetical protein